MTDKTPKPIAKTAKPVTAKPKAASAIKTKPAPKSTAKQAAKPATTPKPRTKCNAPPAPKGNQYAKGHGRPSLYKPEYADAIVAYFKRVANASIEVGKDAQENSKITGVGFVTFEGFAGEIGVDSDTVLAWRSALNPDGTLKYPEFARAYKQCKTIQADLLIRGGLTGAYKGGFATMSAMNLIGWKTQAETHIEHAVTGDLMDTLAKKSEENQRRSKEMMMKVHERKSTS